MTVVDAAIIKALVDHVGSDLPTNPTGTVKVKNLEAETLKVEGSYPWCEMSDDGIYFKNEAHFATNVWFSDGEIRHESGTAYLSTVDVATELKTTDLILKDYNVDTRLYELEQRIFALEGKVGA